MTMAAAAVWGYFRNVPPSVLVGSLEFFIGGIICVSLFHYFIRLFCTLKIKRGEPLSHCDSVSLSCKLVSALFATFACVMGLISKYILYSCFNSNFDGFFHPFQFCVTVDAYQLSWNITLWNITCVLGCLISSMTFMPCSWCLRLVSQLTQNKDFMRYDNF